MVKTKNLTLMVTAAVLAALKPMIMTTIKMYIIL